MCFFCLGFAETFSSCDHYERKRGKGAQRILRLEVEEALQSTRPSDWGWDRHPEHGIRLLARGLTKRRRSVFLILTPVGPTFDRYSTDDIYEYGANWDECDNWHLVTAYPV